MNACKLSFEKGKKKSWKKHTLATTLNIDTPPWRVDDDVVAHRHRLADELDGRVGAAHLAVRVTVAPWGAILMAWDALIRTHLTIRVVNGATTAIDAKAVNRNAESAILTTEDLRSRTALIEACRDDGEVLERIALREVRFPAAFKHDRLGDRWKHTEATLAVLDAFGYSHDVAIRELVKNLPEHLLGFVLCSGIFIVAGCLGHKDLLTTMRFYERLYVLGGVISTWGS